MFLSHFQNHSPKYRVPQAESLEWLKYAHSKTSDQTERQERLFDRIACAPPHIEFRSSEISDYTHRDDESNWILHRQGQQSLEQVMHLYEEATDLAMDKLFAPTHTQPQSLIHVSCTGYLSPSPGQKLVERRGWQDKTTVYHVYHMGCYASFPAITQACGLLSLPSPLRAKTEQQSIDIVHTELCSLHLDLGRTEPDQIVIQSLFADGHIAYKVSRDRTDQPGLKIHALLEKAIPQTSKAMSWRISSPGFQMGLAKEVPLHIKAHIKDYVSELCIKAGMRLVEVLKKGIFAIHPGGPKIIDLIQRELELSEEQIKESRQILAQHGNMSSATIPHIWQQILKRPGALKTPVISVAFGPGLTVSGGAFELQ